MKTSTDQHWNDRALSVREDVEVNIMDVFQRELEYDYILPLLGPQIRLLETGCGNGYSTGRLRPHVRHVDAFDYSEAMIGRARERFGETNNRFIQDNVLDPRHLEGPYDTVLCVRVLINLKNLDEQRRALSNLQRQVRRGGTLILAEGFREGFEALTGLREKVGLPPVQPAAINFYSRTEDLRDLMQDGFSLESEFHLGAYDYLTRVLYPLVVGAENAVPNSVFSERCQQLAKALNPDDLRAYSRMRGFVLRRQR